MWVGSLGLSPGIASDPGAFAPRGDLSPVQSIPQTSLPVVGLAVAGRCIVTIATLRAKLGCRAFRVWESLITRRDRDGFTHATRLGLARAPGYEIVSDHVVKRALARLRSASLVSDRGWEEHLVPVGYKGDKGLRDVFVRRVYGARIVRGRKNETRALVPEATARWLAHACTHGGRRKGAGRKVVSAARPVFTVIDGGRANQVAPGCKESRRPNISASGANQDAPPRDPSVVSVGSSLLSSQSSERSPTPGGGVSLSKVGGMKYNGEEVGEFGVLLGSPGRKPLPIFGDHIPEFPCSMRVPMVRVPSPPLLDARLGPQRRRSTLARWFKCAVVSRFGAKAKSAGAGFARSPKIEKLLDEAANAFVKHEIAPAAWCAWCCDVSLRLFQKDPERPKPPTIFWVYAKRWLDERREWFEHEADTLGGRMIATPAHDELTRLWYRMDKTLRREKAITREAQDEIIVRFFPDDTYRDLVEQAHVQVVKMQNSIDSLARSGDKWMW